MLTAIIFIASIFTMTILHRIQFGRMFVSSVHTYIPVLRIFNGWNLTDVSFIFGFIDGLILFAVIKLILKVI